MVVSAMITGALRDPVLWVMGAVIGWDHARPAPATASLLVAAGGFWGAVRIGVYVIGFGETLGFQGAAVMVLICVALMVGMGLTVRALRWLFAKK